MGEKINREKLIDLVRDEPALWNKCDKVYNNRELKPELWNRIGQSLNTTVLRVPRMLGGQLYNMVRGTNLFPLDEKAVPTSTKLAKTAAERQRKCREKKRLMKELASSTNKRPKTAAERQRIHREKKRLLEGQGKIAQKSWETLRDSYRKIQKKVQSETSSQGNRKQVSWPHYNAMCFLDEMLSPKENYANIIHFQPKCEPQSLLGEENDLSQKEIRPDDNKNSFSTELRINYAEGEIKDLMAKGISIGRNNSFKRSFPFEEILEPEKRKLSILDSHQIFNRHKEPYEADDDYLFLMSLLPYFKKIEGVQKLKLRIEILSYISRELVENTYQEVSGSSWNATAMTLLPRPSSSASSHCSHLASVISSPVNTHDNS